MSTLDIIEIWIPLQNSCKCHTYLLNDILSYSAFHSRSPTRAAEVKMAQVCQDDWLNEWMHGMMNAWMNEIHMLFVPYSAAIWAKVAQLIPSLVPLATVVWRYGAFAKAPYDGGQRNQAKLIPTIHLFNFGRHHGYVFLLAKPKDNRNNL
jgi:hypothetical protein